MTQQEEMVLRVVTTLGQVFAHDLVNHCPLSRPATEEALRGLSARGLLREVEGTFGQWEPVPVQAIPVHMMDPEEVRSLPEEDPEPPPPPSPMPDPLGVPPPGAPPKELPVAQEGAPVGDHADGLVGVLVLGPYRYTVQARRLEGNQWVVILLEQLEGAHVNERGPDPDGTKGTARRLR